MVKLYADLVEKGLYTLDPEKAINGVKLVPDVMYQNASLHLSVQAELNAREEARNNA